MSDTNPPTVAPGDAFDDELLELDEWPDAQPSNEPLGQVAPPPLPDPAPSSKAAPAARESAPRSAGAEPTQIGRGWTVTRCIGAGQFGHRR